jgi:hypothetical protein
MCLKTFRAEVIKIKIKKKKTSILLSFYHISTGTVIKLLNAYVELSCQNTLQFIHHIILDVQNGVEMLPLRVGFHFREQKVVHRCQIW